MAGNANLEIEQAENLDKLLKEHRPHVFNAIGRLQNVVVELALEFNLTSVELLFVIGNTHFGLIQSALLNATQQKASKEAGK